MRALFCLVQVPARVVMLAVVLVLASAAAWADTEMPAEDRQLVEALEALEQSEDWQGILEAVAGHAGFVDETTYFVGRALSEIGHPGDAHAAFIHYIGSGVDGDRRQRARVLADELLPRMEEACREDASDCVARSFRLSNPDAQLDANETAFHLDIFACNAGEALGCGNAGNSLAFGWGQERDVARAVPLLRDACERGSPNGCGIVGWFHLNGVELAQDDDLALNYMFRGCTTGYFFICSEVARMIREGRGVAADPVSAAQLLKQACDLEAHTSCFDLALAYLNGDGIAADPAAAEELFEESAPRLIDYCARYRLGFQCFQAGLARDAGYGVEANPELARISFEQACEAGDRRACARVVAEQ